MAMGDPANTGIEDDDAVPLLLVELEALAKCCEREAWISEKMAEAVERGTEPERKGEWTYAQWSTFYRNRARRWKELEAREDDIVDKMVDERKEAKK
jgi:hypothetical protein